MNLSAVILAGGKSSRMGADNAWLSVSGQPLLSRAMPVQNPAGPCNLGSPSVVYTLYLNGA